MQRPREAGPWTSAASAALLLLLTACADDPKAPAVVRPETVVGEVVAETRATITAVDPKARTVTLRTSDGRSATARVPGDADPIRLKPGQVVSVTAAQRLSIKVLPPGSAPLGGTILTATAKAESGEPPGRAAARVTRVVNEIAGIDRTNNFVTLRGANGRRRTVTVSSPDQQRRLKSLQVGDLAEIDLGEAVAVQFKR
jgi:translation initiation factor IF-1